MEKINLSPRLNRDITLQLVDGVYVLKIVEEEREVRVCLSRNQAIDLYDGLDELINADLGIKEKVVESRKYETVPKGRRLRRV